MNFDFESELTLKRLKPRFKRKFEEANRLEDWEIFRERLILQWPRVFELLFELYGQKYDFIYHLETILDTACESFLERPEDLKALDLQRDSDPLWYRSNNMVGAALYVDLYSENLKQLKEKIPYFKSLGLTYLHLMPLFTSRPGDSDGGYAVSDYRSINPQLGTLDDLVELADELRKEGISLVLDFIFNHTSDDHRWAKLALDGSEEYQNFYYMFPNRDAPDRYEQNLREVFPSVRRGNFTWRDDIKMWVWTTFNSFQWDLNYSNPAVFSAMLGEMLFLANRGVEILRLDAVAFIWKEMGTQCENLPRAHTLIRAFHAVSSLVSPSLLYKSEAIVHPDEVKRYISKEECQLSYNPLLMALLWESLATRETKLLVQSMKHRFAVPEDCTWCNYLRCHDDIGWTFDDDDAWQVGINPQGHRDFLNQFYTGNFYGSFAKGLPFQHNPETGDMRISGTLASLAGLEDGLDRKDSHLIDLACRRIMLLNSVILSIGGIPLIYLGEEWGQLNDYQYLHDPDKSGDSRWVHRGKMKWELLEDIEGEAEEIQRKIFDQVKQLIELRKQCEALAGMETMICDLHQQNTFGYIRQHSGHRLLCVHNFSEHEIHLDGSLLRACGRCRFFFDSISKSEISTASSVPLTPYQSMWLKPA